MHVHIEGVLDGDLRGGGRVLLGPAGGDRVPGGRGELRSEVSLVASDRDPCIVLNFNICSSFCDEVPRYPCNLDL